MLSVSMFSAGFVCTCTHFQIQVRTSCCWVLHSVLCHHVTSQELLSGLQEISHQFAWLLGWVFTDTDPMSCLSIFYVGLKTCQMALDHARPGCHHAHQNKFSALSTLFLVGLQKPCLVSCLTSAVLSLHTDLGVPRHLHAWRALAWHLSLLRLQALWPATTPSHAYHMGLTFHFYDPALWAGA